MVCVLTYSESDSIICRVLRVVRLKQNVRFSFSTRNGVERLREGKGILPPNTDVGYEPK